MSRRHAVPAPVARHRLVVGSAAALALLAGGAATTGPAYADAPTTTMAGSTSPIVLQDRLHELSVGPTAVPEKGPAEVYPMAGTVPAGTGLVTEVQLDLAFEQHTFAADLDVVLVGPDGTAVTVMSDVGKDSDLLGRTYRIGDRFSTRMADQGPNGSGSYKPTDSDSDGEDVFDAPGPAAADANDQLVAFNGHEAAGSWRVFVMDDASGDSGTIRIATVRLFTDGRAAPYQAAITVPGGLGPVTDVDVTLNGLSHSYTGDLQLALVGPGGQSVLLMSDVGEDPVVGDLTFDDEAGPMPEVLPGGGTFHPTGASRGDGPDLFPAPGPALAVLGDQLSVFDGAAATGSWSLFALDDQDQDSGVVAGGWSLTINTSDVPAHQTPSAPQALVSEQVDGVSPRVLRVRPARRPSASVVLRLSEAVTRSSVSPQAVQLRSLASRRAVPVALRLDSGGDRLVVDPKVRLQPGVRYILTVSSRLRDLSGNRLDQAITPGAQAFVKRFTVR